MPKKTKDSEVLNVQLPYTPFPWQAEAHANRTRFQVLVLARRSGKTVFAVVELLLRVLACQNIDPTGAYIAPTCKQAKRVAWRYLKRFAVTLPGVKINESELTVKLPNGGTIFLLGTDNEDGIRGSYFDVVVLDEVGDMGSAVYHEVIRPTLADRKGSAIFLGTPKGENLFYELYLKGVAKLPGWSSLKLNVYEAGSLAEDEIEQQKQEIAKEAFEQEFMCSFTASIKGAYYAEVMQEAEGTGRIGFVPYKKNKKVVVSWDIGLDGTCLWYAQVDGEGVNIIDVDIHEGEDITECARQMIAKPYIYDYQILPHDAVQRSKVNKTQTLQSAIRELTEVKTTIVTRTSMIDGIFATRRFIDECRFDAENCATGLTALRMYRPKPTRGKDSGVQSTTPLHDWTSHVADSLRYMAQGLKRKDPMKEYNGPLVVMDYDVFNYDRM